TRFSKTNLPATRCTCIDSTARSDRRLGCRAPGVFAGTPPCTAARAGFVLVRGRGRASAGAESHGRVEIGSAVLVEGRMAGVFPGRGRRDRRGHGVHRDVAS